MTRRLLEIGAACTVCAIVALVGFLFVVTDETESPGVSTSTLPPRELADPSAFADAWERSLTSDYAIEGTLERTSDRVGRDVVVDVRRARSGSRSLDQTGSTALVVNGGQQQTCEIAASGEVGCGPTSPVKSVADERADLERVLNEDYLIYQDAPNCFLLVATEPAGLGHRFGQESLICFDSATGAIASQREWTGDRQAIFVAETASAVVTERDLTPG